MRWLNYRQRLSCSKRDKMRTYYIREVTTGVYWRAVGQGNTKSLAEAHAYPEEEANKILATNRGKVLLQEKDPAPVAVPTMEGEPELPPMASTVVADDGPVVSSVAQADRVTSFEEAGAQELAVPAMLDGALVESMLSDLSVFFGARVMPVSKYCEIFQKWAQTVQEESRKSSGDPIGYPTDNLSSLQGLAKRLELARLDVKKSSLLARMLYKGEEPRVARCRDGGWATCKEDESCPCRGAELVAAP